MNEKFYEAIDIEVNLTSNLLLYTKQGTFKVTKILLTREPDVGEEIYFVVFYSGTDKDGNPFFQFQKVDYKCINEFSEEDAKFFDKSECNIIDLDGLIQAHPTMITDTSTIIDPDVLEYKEVNGEVFEEIFNALWPITKKYPQIPDTEPDDNAANYATHADYQNAKMYVLSIEDIAHEFNIYYNNSLPNIITKEAFMIVSEALSTIFEL